MKNYSFKQSVVTTQTNDCYRKGKYFESEQALISELRGPIEQPIPVTVEKILTSKLNR